MILVSLPGLGTIFVYHDDVFPNMVDWLRDIAIAWGCVTGSLGLFFIFSGLQESSSPGTLTYRLTHLF
jgi:hypothetical protein